MKLSLSLAKKLLKLLQNKSINSSEFKNFSKVEELIADGIVHVQVKGQNRKIKLLSEDKLYLHLKPYRIECLETYIAAAENSERTRASISQVSNNSKSFKTEVQKGLYLASFEPVEIFINDEKFILETPYMSSFFLHGNSKLTFNPNTVVVGVENFENLTSIVKQKYLFETNRTMVFIYRNSYARTFLSDCYNEYLHYGDFDLAGINIFLNEVIPRLPHKKYSFFIPHNIEELLKKGNSQDYFTQHRKYPNLSSELKYLQDFIELLHQNKRSLHQEYLIMLH